MRSRYLKQITLSLILVVAMNSTSIPAHAEQEEAILPAWQLLNGEQKQQFIAGYLHGLRDAAALTNILEQFLKDNPNASQESVQRLQSLYRSMGSGDSQELARKVDKFLANPRNLAAPMSRAITAE